MTKKPLDGVSVLEVPHDYHAGLGSVPYATLLLADSGADVVVVEPPDGSSQRTMTQGGLRPNVLRNKQSVSIDLDRPQSRHVLAELVAECDVLVHNFTERDITEYDLDYESVKQLNEEVIYCSISAFGDSGPYSEREAFDPIAQAMSGLMFVTGEPDRKPSRIGASLVDQTTGTYTAFAIMVALIHRQRTGEGQRIETSLFETSASFMYYWYTLYSRSGFEPQRYGHAWTNFAPVGVFHTADNPVALAIVFDDKWRTFCDLLDRPEWVDDPRFKTNDARTENRSDLHELIETEFKNYTREELIDLLTSVGIRVGELHSVGDAATDEHLHKRGLFETITDVDGTDVQITLPPIHFSDLERSSGSLPHEAGLHTREVLEQVGFSHEDVSDLIDADVLYEPDREHS